MILTLALALALTQDATSSVARELTEIEQQLGATWKRGDCAGWGAMVAPDWSVIHLTGAIITRAEALEMCKAPPVPIETFDIADVAVRVYGDAAVVTGRTTATTGGPSPATVRLRFTDVFVRRAGRWQVVASQATQVAP